MVHLIGSRNVRLPSKWGDFLALSEKKRDLSAFLTDELIVVNHPPHLESDHEKADTRVILHCIHSKSEHPHRTLILPFFLEHTSEKYNPGHFISSKAGTPKKPKYHSHT